MMKSGILLLALLFASVSAVRFKGNITVNGNANGWDYRRSGVSVIGTPPILTYASVDVDTFRSGHVKQFNVSAIAGGAIFAYGQFPFAYLASEQGEFSRGGNNGNGNGNGNGNHSGDYDLALNYIATSYLRIEEIDSNGTTVAFTSLRNSIPFVPSDKQIDWAVDYVQPYDGTLSAVSVVGKPKDGSSWTINITFIAASVVGVIDLAHAVVGPSSFEQIVQINNYQYQSSSNHLRLVMYTASGSLNADSSTTMTTLTSGSGSSQVYFSASGSAVVNGQTSTVSVNIAVASDTDDDVRSLSDIFIRQLVTKFGSAASYHKVTVDFAAGAQSISYDPSQGAGSQLPASGSSQGSAATSVVASFSLFVLALVALLL